MTYGMLLGSLRLYINKIKHFATSFCCHTDMHSQFYKEVCSCAISNKIQKCQVSKKHQNGSISTTPEEGLPITPFKEEAAHTGHASAPASVLWSSFLFPALWMHGLSRARSRNCWTEEGWRLRKKGKRNSENLCQHYWKSEGNCCSPADWIYASLPPLTREGRIRADHPMTCAYSKGNTSTPSTGIQEVCRLGNEQQDHPQGTWNTKDCTAGAQWGSLVAVGHRCAEEPPGPGKSPEISGKISCQLERATRCIRATGKGHT